VYRTYFKIGFFTHPPPGPLSNGYHHPHRFLSPPPPFPRPHMNPSPGGSDSDFGPTCVVHAHAIKCVPPPLAQSSTHPNHHHSLSPPPPFPRAHTNPSPGGSDSNFGPTTFHARVCPHHPTACSTTSRELPPLPSMAIFRGGHKFELRPFGFRLLTTCKPLLPFIFYSSLMSPSPNSPAAL
jgi:hypothetical protein